MKCRVGLLLLDVVPVCTNYLLYQTKLHKLYQSLSWYASVVANHCCTAIMTEYLIYTDV